MEERRLVLPTLTTLLFLFLCTGIVIIIGVTRDLGFGKLTQVWGRGLFSVLEFTMLSILLWISIIAIVEAPPVGRIIRKLSILPTSHGSAGLLITSTALVFGWVNWILGMCFSLYLAREVARINLDKGIKLHYPYLLSCAFCASSIGLLGLFSPVQLYLGDTITHIGPVKDLVPISVAETVFSPVSLLISGMLVVVLPISLYLMRPKGDESICVIPDEELTKPRPDQILYYKVKPRAEQVPADKLETSVTLALSVSILGLAAICYHLFYLGDPLTFRNAVFLLFMLGLLLNKIPVEYAYKMRETAKASAYIPLSLLLASGLATLEVYTGLDEQLSNSLSALGIFIPIFFFICAFVVALVVPEPSCLWVIFGPLVAGSCLESSQPIILSVIALICGFQLSRFLQPYYHLGILDVSHHLVYDAMAKYLKIIMTVIFVILVIVCVLTL